MKSLIFGIVIATIGCSAAQAVECSVDPNARPCTFSFEGEAWTLISGGRLGAPVSAQHMTPGFGAQCPQHAITQVPVKATAGGPSMKMTKEQTFRGDTRWHNLCDRRAPIPNAQAAAPIRPSVEGVPQPLPRRKISPQGVYQAFDLEEDDEEDEGDDH